MKPKGLNATDKMREWDRRQRDNRRYRNQNCAKFGEETATILRQRKKSRKEARERLIQAHYSAELETKGFVFDMNIDTRQAQLGDFNETET